MYNAAVDESLRFGHRQFGINCLWFGCTGRWEIPISCECLFCCLAVTGRYWMLCCELFGIIGSEGFTFTSSGISGKRFGWMSVAICVRQRKTGVYVNVEQAYHKML